jgi:hypothetical protein
MFYLLLFLGFYLHLAVQWAPLNVSTLGPTISDHKKRTITLTKYLGIVDYDIAKQYLEN